MQIEKSLWIQVLAFYEYTCSLLLFLNNVKLAQKDHEPTNNRNLSSITNDTRNIQMI